MDSLINDNFDLESDYVATPCLLAGSYSVNVTNVSWDSEKMAMVFQLVTEGNDSLKSDGETPADGTTLFYRIWFPRPDDVNKIGTNGLTKRQNKINMINRAFKAMKLNAKTPEEISGLIDNGELIGASFVAKVKLNPPDAYNADMYNEVQNLKAE
jgi:hypothetical protein